MAPIAQWAFRKMQRGEMNADPVQGEFFTPEELADGLVREIGQNSLDAGNGKGPVKVRFAFSSSPLVPETAADYLDGLEDHLAQTLGTAVSLAEPMSYLVIEDFNTRGLKGDPSQDDDAVVSGPGERNDFFYFWRNVGRSSKSDSDRGRWGLGKTVLPASSRINAFLGLTLRESDGKALLMGQAVLKVHKIGADRYDPYGYFAVRGADGFPNPLGEQGAIDRFKKDFGLRRTSEPGLSIAVPFARVDELQPNSLVRSVIAHYFFPILAGELEVDVEQNGEKYSINSSSIFALAKDADWTGTRITPDGLKSLFELASWAIKLPDADHVRLAEQDGGAPAWKPELIDAKSLAGLREKYEKNEPLALKVPVKVERLKQAPKTTWFSAYLKRDESLTRGEDHYIRQGITISEVHLLKEKGARGLLVVDDPDLSAMLGDSENPAHTEWQLRATKLKERYKYGHSCVNFVRNSLRQLVELISKPPEGLDKDLLRDSFFVELPKETGDDAEEGESPAEGQKPGEEPPPPHGDPFLPLPQQPFTVKPLADGFHVTPRKVEGQVVSGKVIRIEMAYEVRRGNPFKRYDQNDFCVDAAPISVSMTGAERLEPESTKKNVLRIRAKEEAFDVKVTGFDPHRDLKVKAAFEKEVLE